MKGDAEMSRLLNSSNSMNPLNKVLQLRRAEVLQLDYLTATLQNRSTATREV